MDALLNHDIQIYTYRRVSNILPHSCMEMEMSKKAIISILQSNATHWDIIILY